MIDKNAVVLGYDIGGTKLGIGLGRADGTILGEYRMPNVNTSPDDVLPHIAGEAKRLVSEAGLKMSDVAAFGISAPFPADAKRGIMTRPVNNPLWRDVPILDYLRGQLGIGGCFENDANCGALAEWFFGAGRGCTDFMYLTMSTGIGGGIIAGNNLIRGGNSLSAGEIGHTCVELNGRLCSCGLRGCYEAYCGGRAIALRIREELKDKPDAPIMRLAGGNPENIDMKLLVEAVKQKDAYALALWDEITTRNAQAFGMFINIFNPQKLILGTFAWAIGDLFMAPILKKLPGFCWKQMKDDCEIVASELKSGISNYAGIAAALNYLKENE